MGNIKKMSYSVKKEKKWRDAKRSQDILHETTEPIFLRFTQYAIWAHFQLEEYRHNYELGIDRDTNQPFMKSQVDITRQEVETNVGLDDFECRCYATAGSLDQAIRSEIASLKVACKYLSFIEICEDI